MEIIKNTEHLKPLSQLKQRVLGSHYFASEYSLLTIRQQAADQLPWGHKLS